MRTIIRILPLALPVLLFAVLSSPFSVRATSSSVIVYTNLGAGGTFQTGQVHQVGNSSSPYFFDTVIAEPFVPSATVHLTDVTLAIGNCSVSNPCSGEGGTNTPVTVYLEADNSGQPGAILDTLTQVGTLGPEPPGALVTFQCTTCPLIVACTQYWIVATELDPSSTAGWNWSNSGFGPFWYTQNGSVTGPWKSTGSWSTAAFQVDGSPVTLSYPTASAPENYVFAGFWNMNVDVSDEHGLEITDVMLGKRYMARQMNLPYFNLETSDFGQTPMPCKLTPKPDTTSAGCQSQLVDYKTDAHSVEATYAISQIPMGSNSCLTITQTYDFTPPVDPRVLPSLACEPTAQAPCARFKPIVKFNFMPGNSSEEMHKINVAQRLRLAPDGTAGSTALLAHDCDFGDFGPGRPCNLYIDQPVIVPLFGGNPLPKEVVTTAIMGGAPGDGADNYHQTPLTFISEPVGYPANMFGCPECVHTSIGAGQT